MTLNSVFIHLPERLSKAIINLKAENITEIRLRSDAPVSITCDKGNVIFNENGRISSPEKSIMLSKKEIEDTVNSLCGFSRYSFDEYIKNGFIPIEGGGRAGICGKAVLNGGKIKTFSHISSVNIRLNIFLPYIAKDTAALFEDYPKGILIYSAPGIGKTTYLKSLIYLLSTGKYSKPFRLGVIDERFELEDHLLKKGLSDFISGASKSFSIELLTRTMSPEIIICDEVQNDEIEIIRRGCNSGVKFICSAHGKSIKEIKQRGFGDFFNFGIFEYAVGIEKEENQYIYETTRIF